jgi:uncharacterized protein (DUF3084 family)
MRTKIDELFATLRGLVADQSRDLALAMGELRAAEAERDRALAERDNARQSLRAAEQEVAEMEADYADLRTVNARLVADLAAAMERLDHAESIIMQ